MKFALLCALLLATAAVGTSCCSQGTDDIITVALDNSAGIPPSDNIFPSDCRPPQVMVPVGR